MSSNERKNQTLGMPHGTASSRLRKNILFHLLKKHGENYCFKCSELIEIVDDLSIEHKQPWEGISAELFWDLDNIAFSHLHCNRPHRNGGGDNRILYPNGKAWCSDCKRFKSVDDFNADSSRASNTDVVCRVCKSVRNKQRVR
jgi:hypothetical protein